jgi:hypothetical protein
MMLERGSDPGALHRRRPPVSFVGALRSLHDPSSCSQGAFGATAVPLSRQGALALQKRKTTYMGGAH